MKLTITLHYDTQWGENIHLAFSTVANVHSASTQCMQTDGQGRWFITLEGDYKASTPYTFVVVENGAIKRTEWRHHLLPETLHGHVHISDHWIERSSLAPFYSSAFTKAIFAHDAHGHNPHGAAGICICCDAPTLRKGQMLAVCGDVESLGGWDVDRARLMEPYGTEWQLWLNKDEMNEYCEFKFIILEKDAASGKYQLVAWELGDNRQIHIDHYSDVTLRVLRN